MCEGSARTVQETWAKDEIYIHLLPSSVSTTFYITVDWQLNQLMIGQYSMKCSWLQRVTFQSKYMQYNDKHSTITPSFRVQSFGFAHTSIIITRCCFSRPYSAPSLVLPLDSLHMEPCELGGVFFVQAGHRPWKFWSCWSRSCGRSRMWPLEPTQYAFGFRR
jgi:hypothetical protein